MKLNFSKKWLKQAIENEPDDCEIGVGLPIETKEDIDNATKYIRAHVPVERPNKQ